MSSAQSISPKVFRISLDTGEQFDCADDQKILIAMEQAQLHGVPVGCRGGGCGACRVEVIKGEYQVLRMSKNHVSDEEAADGFALACRIMPTSDLRIRVALKAHDVGEPQAIAANT